MGPRGRLRWHPAALLEREVHPPVPVAVLQPAHRRVRRQRSEPCAHPRGHRRGRAARSRRRLPAHREDPHRRGRPAALAPHTTFDEGIELCKLAEAFGYDAVTPVGLSVFPHGSLCRGGYPNSITDTKAIKERFDEALDRSKLKWAVLKWGYRRAAKQYPFEPVWNRPYFTAAKRAVNIPVFSVGGIRTFEECEGILERGEADMVGMGRPFYADPDLPARLLAGHREPMLCQSSNRCLPAQQLGMKAACYNPEVQRMRAERRRVSAEQR